LATNDFLAWAIGGSANVESQASYAADPKLLNGYQTNDIVPGSLLNKQVRQASFVAAAVAQLVTDNLNSSVADGGVVATFEGQLRSALGYASGVQVWSISSTTFDHYTNVLLHGSSSGVITQQLQAAAGTYNWNLPVTAGASGSMLTSGGGGATAMTWTASTGTGSVVLSNGPTFVGSFAVSGSGSGTVSFVTQAAAGTYNWNWPITAGAAGQPLVSQGGAATAMTWNAVTGTGNFVMSANSTLTGVTTVSALRTGTAAINSGSNLTINTFYNAFTIPVGVTMFYLTTSGSGIASSGVVFYDGSATTAFMVTPTEGTNIGWQASGGVLQVENKNNGTSTANVFWTTGCQ